MKIEIHFNRGGSTEMHCPDLDNGTLHTLGRQISNCDLVFCVDVFDKEAKMSQAQPLRYVKGFTQEGA